MVSDRDFDNPADPGRLLEHDRRDGTVARVASSSISTISPTWRWAGRCGSAAHDWLARPLVFVTPTYPGLVGRQLRCVRFGKPHDASFSTGNGMSVGYRVVSAYLNRLVCWRTGVPATVPVGLGDLGPVARHPAELTTRGRPPCVVTSPSTAARIVAAAEGQCPVACRRCFLLGGEPVTLARRRGDRGPGRPGVRDLRDVGDGLDRRPVRALRETDGVHLLQDGVAVVSRARRLATGRDGGRAPGDGRSCPPARS